MSVWAFVSLPIMVQKSGLLMTIKEHRLGFFRFQVEAFSKVTPHHVSTTEKHTQTQAIVVGV